MATVTVQIGQACAGGGHIEVITLVDGKQTASEWVEKDKVIKAGQIVIGAAEAKNKIVLETEAPNFNSWKAQAEAKSETVKGEKANSGKDGKLLSTATAAASELTAKETK